MAEALIPHLAALAAAHPGLSGVRLIDDGAEALDLRLQLIAAARTRIDLQYYIWADDKAGHQLLAALADAAARGVHVRLLLDDHGTSGLDAALAALVALPHIEVRLFNAFRLRSPKWLNFLWDFRRLNRRMHNKCLIVDGTAAIIGGRNIADEYFSVDHPALAADLDALGIGAVAADVAADFERYWASPVSTPIGMLVKGQGALPSTSPPEPPPQPLPWHPEASAFDWVPVQMISDDPAKITDSAPDAALWLPQLLAALGPLNTRLFLVSAYFVPTEAGIALLERLAASGVDVQVLTNSFRSNNVALAHAGYAPVRARLLAAGIRLWEMKGTRTDRTELGLVPRRLRRPTGAEGKASLTAFFRTSASALHAKTFVADGDRLFVGSMNFDSRSWHLNTEIGFLIESPALAARVEARLAAMLPGFAWEVKRAPARGLSRLWSRTRLEWHDEATVSAHEPFTHAGHRAALRLLGLLPIAWLL
jgi:putative cardiolipin synthase